MIEKQTISRLAEKVGFSSNLRDTHRHKIEALVAEAYTLAMREAAELVDSNFYDYKTVAAKLRDKALNG